MSPKVLTNLSIIPDKNYSALGIIDRFIRTLRDMNTPNEKSKSQSHENKYRVFSYSRMQKLIEIYIITLIIQVLKQLLKKCIIT